MAIYFEEEEFLDTEVWDTPTSSKNTEPEYKEYKGFVKVKMYERHDGKRWIRKDFKFYASSVKDAYDQLYFKFSDYDAIWWIGKQEGKHPWR